MAKKKVDTVRDAREQRERFEDYVQEYQGARAPARVKALRGFNAVVVRKGDTAEQVRGSEYVAPGDVVDVVIDNEGGVQDSSIIAWMRARGDFEPTADAHTDAPDDDVYHGTMTTADVNAARLRTYLESDEGDDDAVSMTKGELKGIVAGAIRHALAGQQERPRAHK